MCKKAKNLHIFVYQVQSMPIISILDTKLEIWKARAERKAIRLKIFWDCLRVCLDLVGIYLYRRQITAQKKSMKLATFCLFICLTVTTARTTTTAERSFARNLQASLLWKKKPCTVRDELSIVSTRQTQLIPIGILEKKVCLAVYSLSSAQ